MSFTKSKMFLAVPILLAMNSAVASAHDLCNTPITTEKGLGVEMIGILNKSKEWGPPNFGQTPNTDSKVEIFTISPPINQEFNMQASDGAHEILVNKIKITSNGTDRKLLDKLVGRVIRASGRLWPATTSGDYTPIVLDASSIKEFRGDDSEVKCSD